MTHNLLNAFWLVLLTVGLCMVGPMLLTAWLALRR